MGRVLPYLVIAALLTGFLVVFALIALEGANRALDASAEELENAPGPVQETSAAEFTPSVDLDTWYGEPPPRFTAPIPSSQAALRAIERETVPELLDVIRRDTTLLAIDLAVRDPVVTDRFVDALVAIYGPGGSPDIALYFVSVLSQAEQYADLCPLAARLLAHDLRVHDWIAANVGTYCPGGAAFAFEREVHSFAAIGPDEFATDPRQDLEYRLSLCDDAERPLFERALVRCASDAADPNEQAAECLRVLAGMNWPLARRTAEAIERLDGDMATWDEVRSLRRFESSAAVERAAIDLGLVSADAPRIERTWSEVSLLHVLLNRTRGLCFHAPRGLGLELTWMLEQLAQVVGLDGIHFEEYEPANGVAELRAYLAGNVYRSYALAGTTFDAYALTAFVNAILEARGFPDRLVSVSGGGNCVARNSAGSIERAVREGYLTFIDFRALAGDAATSDRDMDSFGAPDLIHGPFAPGEGDDTDTLYNEDLYDRLFAPPEGSEGTL